MNKNNNKQEGLEERLVELEFARSELERCEQVHSRISYRATALRTEMRAQKRVSIVQRARLPKQPVDDGPVKENIITGDDINLFDFPVPKWHREDGGRYINTFQATITKDPDTGQHNLGIYRGMIGKKDTLPVLLWRAQNWGVHFQKWKERGEKMPVAHVYGWEPCLPFCASAPIPTGVSEYEVMGSIRGEPVPLVKCETVDLMVPASAEMVVEGYIDDDPSTYEMEGPFGEYTGYFGGDQGPKHVTKVTCITHRNDPIFRGTLEGTLPKMLNENSIMSSVQRAGGISFSIAAFSAGNPKASQPIGCKTLKPRAFF